MFVFRAVINEKMFDLMSEMMRVKLESVMYFVNVLISMPLWAYGLLFIVILFIGYVIWWIVQKVWQNCGRYLCYLVMFMMFVLTVASCSVTMFNYIMNYLNSMLFFVLCSDKF